MKRRRRPQFIALALLLSVATAAVVGEVVVRLSGATSSPRRHFRPGIYAADPTLGWALLPSYRGVHVEYAFEAPTSTNALGYRGPAWDEARAGAAMRVLALGDSCTFGRGVADDETYPARLEVALREAGHDAAVFNAGIPGHDTQQELEVLRRVAPLVKPTVVIVGWLPNDVIERSVDAIGALQVIDGQLVDDVERYQEWKAQIEGRGVNGSALYRFLRVRWKLLLAAAGDRRDDPRESRMSDEQLAYSHPALREIVETARGLGATPVVVLFPREEEVRPPLAESSHHDRMEALARGLGAEVVNLARVLRERPTDGFYLPRDAVHFTPAGYEAIAREVAAAAAFRR